MRHRRLQRALADFDAATIATTHGFCQEVLGGMGIDGDVEPDAAFVEDVRDLLSEVVDDLYVRRFHSRDTPDFDRREAMRIAEIAVANPAAPLEPQHAPQDTVEAMRVRLADARARGARAAQARDGRHDLRRPAHPAGRRAGQARPRRSACASATASCSSTSSRTPIPSSGGSCAAPSGPGT